MGPPKHDPSGWLLSYHTACLSWMSAAPICSIDDGIQLAGARPYHKELLEHDEPRKAPPAKPSLTPDSAGPIVGPPMGLPVTVHCDKAWDLMFKTQRGEKMSSCTFLRLI
jgi:hypothetical protein